MSAEEKELLEQTVFSNWKEDRITGFGKMTYSDNTVYVGHFLLNQKNGLGKVNFADNTVHLGEYLKGLADGIGYFRWAHYGLPKEIKLFNGKA